MAQWAMIKEQFTALCLSLLPWLGPLVYTGDGTKKKKHRKGKSGGGSGNGGGSRGSDSGGGGGNSGEDNGGAVEAMDQDGSDVGGPSGRVYPADWATKTKDQKKKNIYKRRRQYGPFAFAR